MTYRMPAEWRPHEAVWLAWPSHPDEWPGTLAAARAEHAALCAAIADVVDGAPRGERVELMVLPGESEASARAALAGVPVSFRRIPFGDIWLRDTGPIFVEGDGGLAAACFGWNGWGGKYHFEHDDQVSRRIAELTETPALLHLDVVLEGGAVEVDGEGTLLTTRQCVLDPERNPGLAQAAAEDLFRRALGAERVVWLEHTLANDHTDGHIDTLCRFTRPGQVVCMAPVDDDPNRAVLLDLHARLGEVRDATGRRLEVVTVPSPGRVTDGGGALVAASYANYYVGNSTVVVPTYGSPSDAAAVAAIAALYPGRRTVGSPSRAIVTAGGSFHCITQQQPRRSS